MDVRYETLESLCEFIVDCPHSTPKWTDEGIVVLRNQNIRNGVLDLTDPSFTNEEDYQKRIKRAVPQADDIVFTREAPMGEVCLIPKNLKCCLGQRQVLLRPKKDISGEYLFWALQSPYVQHQISWNEGTGTTVSNVRIPVLKALSLPRHPQDEAEVSGILSALANKIQLNRQINQTLEQMAQALFKSWFVDFDPIIDNALAAGNPIPPELEARAEGRKSQQARAAQPAELTRSGNVPQLPKHIRTLFPDRFSHHPKMGWIPAGWEVKPLSITATLHTKSVRPNNEPDKSWTHFSIPAFDANCCPTKDSGDSIKSGKYKVPKFAVLASKLNPETSRIWLPEVVEEESSVCSTEFMPFVPNQGHQRAFLYALLCSESVQLAICYRATGSTGSRQRVKPKEIAEMPVLLPNNELIDQFSLQAQPIYEKAQKGLNNNLKLTKLLNTLLPKLISGELRLPESAPSICIIKNKKTTMTTKAKVTDE